MRRAAVARHPFPRPQGRCGGGECAGGGCCMRRGPPELICGRSRGRLAGGSIGSASKWDGSSGSMPCGEHGPIRGREGGATAGGSTGGGRDPGSGAESGVSGFATAKLSDAPDSWNSTCPRTRLASVSNSSDVNGTGEAAGGCGDGSVVGVGCCGWAPSAARSPERTSCVVHPSGGGECGGGSICVEPSPGGAEGTRHARGLELPAHAASSLSASLRKRSMACV